MTKKKWILTVLCMMPAFVLLFFFSACASQKAGSHPAITGSHNAYTAALSAALPDYPFHSSADQNANPFSGLSQGSLSVCLDVQALPALEQDLAAHFLPQCLVTVVLAVDRSQTDFVPLSWHDLSESDVTVGIPSSDADRRIILAAIARGLEGEQYTADAALDFLDHLHAEGRLSDDPGKAVTICPDNQAVQLRQENPDIEIIVPSDGTLTFSLGILSDVPVDGLSEEALLSAGLRLLNGECRNRLYPDRNAYRSAFPVQDTDRFLAVTRDATRTIRRGVFHTRLFSSADGREHILMFVAALILILLWSASALHRSSQSSVRRWVLTVSGLCTCWILLSLFKFQLPATLLNRLCWYSYYIFLLSLPLTLLCIAAVIDRPAGSRHLPGWVLPFAALCPVLILLVLTNDFHQLVFRFDPNRNWNENYTYRPGYFLIFAYCIVTFLISIFLLLKKSRKSPNRYACIGPVCTAALLIGYNAGYALGIPVIRSSNLTLLFCLLTVLFMESVLNAGLIPSNTHYSDLFSASPLNMQLLDEDGNTALSSARAEPLSPRQRESILASPGISMTKNADTLLHSSPIPGGIAVWQEDISALNQLHRQTAASILKLQSANALLSRDSEIQKQKIASDVKSRLLTQLEQDIAEKSAALTEAIRNLSDRKPEREQQISYITLLLCHIKRRSNLFFIAQEGRCMPGVELAVYLDELSEFASYAGIRTLVRSGELGDIDVKSATLCYDFYFSVLSWAIQDSRATLIGQFGQKDGILHFGILSSESTDALHFSDTFCRTADSLHADITRRRVEESDGIYLACPQEGGPD